MHFGEQSITLYQTYQAFIAFNFIGCIAVSTNTSGTKTSVTHGHDYFKAMILILLVLCTTSCSSELRFCDTKVICFIIVSLLGNLYVLQTKVDKNQFSAVLVGAALNIAIVTLGWEFAFGPILDHLKLIGWN